MANEGSSKIVLSDNAKEQYDKLNAIAQKVHRSGNLLQRATSYILDENVYHNEFSDSLINYGKGHFSDASEILSDMHCKIRTEYKGTNVLKSHDVNSPEYKDYKDVIQYGFQQDNQEFITLMRFMDVSPSMMMLDTAINNQDQSIIEDLFTKGTSEINGFTHTTKNVSKPESKTLQTISQHDNIRSLNNLVENITNNQLDDTTLQSIKSTLAKSPLSYETLLLSDQLVKLANGNEEDIAKLDKIKASLSVDIVEDLLVNNYINKASNRWTEHSEDQASLLNKDAEAFQKIGINLQEALADKFIQYSSSDNKSNTKFDREKYALKAVKALEKCSGSNNTDINKTDLNKLLGAKASEAKEALAGRDPVLNLENYSNRLVMQEASSKIDDARSDLMRKPRAEINENAHYKGTVGKMAHAMRSYASKAFPNYVDTPQDHLQQKPEYRKDFEDEYNLKVNDPMLEVYEAIETNDKYENIGRASLQPIEHPQPIESKERTDLQSKKPSQPIENKKSSDLQPAKHSQPTEGKDNKVPESLRDSLKQEGNIISDAKQKDSNGQTNTEPSQLQNNNKTADVQSR